MATCDGHASPAASPWVVRWASRLPDGATVLDLACGRGRHVRWLSGRGLRVTAVDRDPAAVEALRGLAGVEIVVADIESGPWPLDGRRFDAIVVTNYLWRPLWPQLLDSLQPGGLLIYETFNVDHAGIGKPSNPDFLLEHGELLERTGARLRVLGYEDGFVADPDRFVQRIAAFRRLDDPTQQKSMSAQARRFPL